MTEHIEHIHTVRDDDVARDTTREIHQPASYTAANTIWTIAGILISLLGIRFVLLLLGANAGNVFVNFIYSLTWPFVSPFFGIFNYRTNYGVSRFEIAALLAMGVYALIAWAIARLVTIRHPHAY
jgi:YggT family protein